MRRGKQAWLRSQTERTKWASPAQEQLDEMNGRGCIRALQVLGFAGAVSTWKEAAVCEKFAAQTTLRQLEKSVKVTGGDATRERLTELKLQ